MNTGGVYATGDRAVAVGGNIQDSIIVTGDRNVFLIQQSDKGALATPLAPADVPKPVPRSRPVSLRPRPFPGLLDRETEVSRVFSTSGAPFALNLYGPAGSGKTVLLRHLAHDARTDSFRDGVIYLSARGQHPEDLAYSIFDAFFESTVPTRRSQGELREWLKDISGLVLIDDVGTEATDDGRELVGSLADLAPTTTMLFASLDRCMWEGDALKLAGLPPVLARILVERVLERSLDPAEEEALAALCESLDGNPLSLSRVAAVARDRKCSLTDCVDDGHELVTGLSNLSNEEKDVLALLGAVAPAPLAAEHLSDLLGADASEILTRLEGKRLVQTHSPRFSLASDLPSSFPDDVDGAMGVREIDVYLTRWAEDKAIDMEAILDNQELLVQELHRVEDALALRLGSALDRALLLSGRWGAWGSVLTRQLVAAERLEAPAILAFTLHQAGTRALALGDLEAARHDLQRALEIRERLGDAEAVAATRSNLGHLGGGSPFDGDGPSPPRPPLLGVITTVAVMVVVLLGFGIIRADDEDAQREREKRETEQNEDVPTPDEPSPSPANPILEVTPTSLDFEDVYVGSAETQQMVVTLDGADPAPFVTAVEGEAAPDFMVEENDCGGYVGPDGCVLIVTFTPSAEGGRVATLSIDASGRAVLVTLSGMGYSIE